MKMAEFVKALNEVHKYYRPLPAGHPSVQEVRGENGLGDFASLAEIEPIALNLLENNATAYGAAHLVLNRDLVGGEQPLARIITHRGLRPDEKFDLLVLLRTIEEKLKEGTDRLRSQDRQEL